MPRVHNVKKSKAGAKPTCGKCGKKVKPGTRYYWWKFRYGGKRVQCEACGYPRRGQLTQSKLGTAYDACDDAEETIGTVDAKEDIADALRNAADTIREVAQEYEDAKEAMGAAGEAAEWAEYPDELETFASELEDAAGSIESEEPEDQDEDDWDEDAFIEEMREQARDALSNFPL